MSRRISRNWKSELKNTFDFAVEIICRTRNWGWCQCLGVCVQQRSKLRFRVHVRKLTKYKVHGPFTKKYKIFSGITPENEQSSLHLSAIFDSEDSPKTKYPNHYESETKSRIQSLNRVFLELKSFFEDRYSQLVAIRPPNSVHITSSCGSCSVQEFEKLLFLLLGAAIQGTQKQDTIRTIKRFPANIQESLIECVKLVSVHLR